MNDKIINSNYGSIPHLSTSKLTQQADKKIEMGQELILTKKTRDWKDLVIVTEKLDGSNVGVIRKNGKLYAISRSGYLAETSPYEQHHLFAEYVKGNIHLFERLPEGWRIAGEWCIIAHGTKYNITGMSPFVAFDIFTHDNKRLTYLEFIALCSRYGIWTVPLLHIGQPIRIDNAIKLLSGGHYGIAEKPEGFVYRCEREGNVEFLAKWVRADKEDGKYLDEDIYNEGFDNMRHVFNF